MTHAVYSRTANCRTKLLAIFRDIFGIFRGVSTTVILFIPRYLAEPSLGNTRASKELSCMFSQLRDTTCQRPSKTSSKIAYIYTLYFIYLLG